MDTKGKVEMLAPGCDYDDIHLLKRLLWVLNQLKIPKNTMSFISRSRQHDDYRIFFDHTIVDNF